MEIIESSIAKETPFRYSSSLILGLSIGNSYFSNENIFELISFASFWSSRIYIMIPDAPMVYSLMAKDYHYGKALREVTRKSNNLANKCKKAIGELRLEKYVQIIRWRDISATPDRHRSYISSLEIVNKSYDSDIEFRKSARETTRAVLLKENSALTEAKIDIGVKFLLEELAFILNSNAILGEKWTVYVYHNKMQLLVDIINSKYNIKTNPNVDWMVIA